jgi:hypothetical protein
LATIRTVEEPMEDLMDWSWRRAVARIGDAGRADPDLVARAMDEAREAKAAAVLASKRALQASIDAHGVRTEANNVWAETQMLGELVAALLARVAFEAAKGGDTEVQLNALLAAPLGMQKLSEENGAADQIMARRRRLLAHLGDTARSHLATLSHG